jgi:hypothetical protein
MAPKKAIKAMRATTPVKKAEMAKSAMKATTPVKKAEKAMKATTSVKAMKPAAKPPVIKAEKAKISMKATKAKAEPKTVVFKKVWQKSYDGKYRSWVLLKLEQDRGAVVEHWQGTLH